MDEKTQILFMQIRILRIASTRLKRSLKDTAMLFRQFDVLPYIREGYGIFHVEGDDAVYEDVKSIFSRKGPSYERTHPGHDSLSRRLLRG